MVSTSAVRHGALYTTCNNNIQRSSMTMAHGFIWIAQPQLHLLYTALALQYRTTSAAMAAGRWPSVVHYSIVLVLCTVYCMCWTLVAEEPRRSIILNLNLEHHPLKANARCLVFPLHQGEMSSAQPLRGLDSPSQLTRELLSISVYICAVHVCMYAARALGMVLEHFTR
jgi:hypothetical protein